MNQHIFTTLASLHSRLALLENQIYLKGKEIQDDHDTDLKLQSLKTLRQAVVTIHRSRQLHGQTTYRLRMGHPQFATEEAVLNSFGPHEPFLIAHVDIAQPTKFPLICIFASERDDTFKYIVRYFSSPEHSSIDTTKPGGREIMESFKCRTAQEVYDTLQSMMFPTQ